jgi:spore photoproduct lyase
MQACSQAGYPLRAVMMPIIPIENWQGIYGPFLEHLLRLVPLQRITFGQICSYAGALRFMEAKLGRRNPVSTRLRRAKSADGRTRQIRPGVEIGLCLEERRTFAALGIADALGRCHCVI